MSEAERQLEYIKFLESRLKKYEEKESEEFKTEIKYSCLGFDSGYKFGKEEAEEEFDKALKVFAEVILQEPNVAKYIEELKELTSIHYRESYEYFQAGYEAGYEAGKEKGDE